MDKSDSKYCDCAVTLPFSNARIAADRGRADAGLCHRHGDRCCRVKNQTILGDSHGRQGGRRALHDGYAPVSFLMRRIAHAHERTGPREKSPVGVTDAAMKTFHEWLADRMKNEGLWLNDNNAVIGLSRLNPLPKDSAVNKSLAKGPAKSKAMPGIGIQRVQSCSTVSSGN